MKSLLSCFALFACLLIQQTAEAAIAVRFSADGSIPSGSTINVTPGTSVLVEMFAFETAPNTELSVDGLFGFGLAGTFNTGLGTITDVSVDPAFPFLPLTGFDNVAGTLDLSSNANFGASVKAATIRLGSFTYNATNPGLTTFTLADPDPTLTNSDFAAGDFATIDLDPIVFGPARTITFDISINAASSVPEPSSLLFCAGLLGAVGVRFRRRRRGTGQAGE